MAKNTKSKSKKPAKRTRTTQSVAAGKSKPKSNPKTKKRKVETKARSKKSSLGTVAELQSSLNSDQHANKHQLDFKDEHKHEKKEKEKKRKKLSLADKADKFKCYEKSVQCPEHDANFFELAYRDVNRKKPLTLREDFCGTFAVCCEWVAANPKRTAVGVDLCPETIRWGRDHNLSRLKPEQQSRIRLLEQDVRVKNLPPVDVLAAQNFSFWIFQTRLEVITYLRAARENLKPGGVMVLDMMGGPDCYREGAKDKKVIGKGKKKFNYYWKQVSFNPANNRAKFSISFRFRDGSKLENAFEYDWRFWTIPEVREMLVEAGFTSSKVYFENEDDDSIWEPREHAPSHSVWLAYIVAVR